MPRKGTIKTKSLFRATRSYHWHVTMYTLIKGSSLWLAPCNLLLGADEKGAEEPNVTANQTIKILHHTIIHSQTIKFIQWKHSVFFRYFV